MRGKGHRRWSWAGRRATGQSRCSARGRCCRGWWRSSRRSECSDPYHSGAPGLCTVTEDGEEGEERQRCSVTDASDEMFCANFVIKK